MRHLNVRRTKSVFATSLSSSVEMLATSPFVLSPFAESFSGRWETVSVGIAATEGAILSSLEQRGCGLCPWQRPDHLARHDGERRSYIVLCAPHDVCSPLLSYSQGGQVPLEKSHDGLPVGCPRLPTSHFGKAHAPLNPATGFPSSPSKFRVEESHDPRQPEDPTNPRPVQCDPIDPIDPIEPILGQA